MAATYLVAASVALAAVVFLLALLETVVAERRRPSRPDASMGTLFWSAAAFTAVSLTALAWMAQ